MNHDRTIAPDPRVLTSADVARMLGVSPRTLARWHALRVGPARCKIGRKVLYRLETVVAWLAENEEDSVDARGRSAR